MSNWKIDYGNDQHQGRRKEQQDYFASFEPSMQVVKSNAGFLAVVADGMGGHTGGAQASLIAINTFVKEYQHKSENESIPDALNRSLLKANAAVFKANLGAGPNADMGTTLVAIVLKSNKLYWVSVGDSSLFLLRDNKLEKLNDEHNYGAVLDRKVSSGQLSKAQADAESKKRNMLTSYLGLEEIPIIDLQKIPKDLKINDKIVLCSDGLVDALTPQEITSCLKSIGTSQTKSESLTKLAIDKQRKNQDNITTIVLEIKKVEPEIKISKEPEIVQKKEDKINKKKINLYINTVIVLLLISIASLSYFLFKKIYSPQTSISETENSQVNFDKKDHTKELTKNPSTPQTKLDSSEWNNQEREEIQDNSPKEKKSSFHNDPYLFLKIQVVLKGLKLYKGNIDNELGTKTEKALKKYQKYLGLQETGQLDDKTLKEFEIDFKSEEYKDKISTEIEKIEKMKKEDDRYLTLKIQEDPYLILKIQYVLKKEHAYGEIIDNLSGPNTKNGIKIIQKRMRHENPTGEYDRKTEEIMTKLFKEYDTELKKYIRDFKKSRPTPSNPSERLQQSDNMESNGNITQTDENTNSEATEPTPVTFPDHSSDSSDTATSTTSDQRSNTPTVNQ